MLVRVETPYNMKTIMWWMKVKPQRLPERVLDWGMVLQEQITDIQVILCPAQVARFQALQVHHDKI
jgi:hypothetical protein